MSTVVIHIPDEKEEVLMNFLKSVPYITIEKEQKQSIILSNWRMLEGKYTQSGITSATLAQENEREKEHERNQNLQ